MSSIERGGVTLEGGERLACEHVVLATGPWAAELTGLPLEPRKGQLVALAAPPGLIRHKLIEAAYVDAVADSDEGLAIAVVVEQTLDGDEVLVGSSRERVGFEPTVRDEVTHAMLERAARFVPRLRDLRVTRSWCGFRPWLPDGLPAIGAARRRHLDEHRPRGRGRLPRSDLGTPARSDDLRRAARARPDAVRPAPLQRGALFLISITCWNVARAHALPPQVFAWRRKIRGYRGGAPFARRRLSQHGQPRARGDRLDLLRGALELLVRQHRGALEREVAVQLDP